MQKNANLLLLLSLVLFTGCPQDAPSTQSDADRKKTKEKVADGTADAEKDIQSGVLKVWTQPLPSPPWAGKYFRLCKDKGIALKSTRTVDEFKTDYITDYNRRMMAEIDKKWGAGILQKLERQAQEQ